MRRKERGITLIALVVTIVVLLILAAVSISMLGGENGIITQAQRAKEDNDIAEEREKVQLAAAAAKAKTNWGEITQDNLEDELDTNIGNGKYTLTKDGDKFIVTYNDSKRSYDVDANGNIIEAVKREGLKVGDYINYIPDSNTEGYSADRLTKDITGSAGNTSIITQDQQYAKDGEGMTWQILRLYADGSMDLIGSETVQDINFNLENGYNNGVTVLNDICKTLYSRGEIKARSVKYEDLEYWLTEEGKAVRDADGYGQTNTYTTNTYYPNLYAQEIGAGIDTKIVNTKGLGISDEGIAIGIGKAQTTLTVTQTDWYGDMDSTNFGEGYKALKTNDNVDGGYWVASRYSGVGSSYAYFGLTHVLFGVISGDYLIDSEKDDVSGDYAHIRPVVTLNSSVQIENCTGKNTIDNMHIITKY